MGWGKKVLMHSGWKIRLIYRTDTYVTHSVTCARWRWVWARSTRVPWGAPRGCRTPTRPDPPCSSSKRRSTFRRRLLLAQLPLEKCDSQCDVAIELWHSCVWKIHNSDSWANFTIIVEVEKRIISPISPSHFLIEPTKNMEWICGSLFLVINTTLYSATIRWSVRGRYCSAAFDPCINFG